MDCYNSLDKLDKHKQRKKRYYISSDERKEKEYVRSRTNVLLRKHGLVKDCKCQLCGNKRSETHHVDYQDIIHILFVCSKCHKAIHANNIHKYQYVDISLNNRKILSEHTA